ncbi:transaldolase/EF-hand domain-containing protein [Gimesia chilikensis]|uniref:Transaldolase/EF-hand domain-containing protein n=1 Tax=Gimesia chilikensis TaxID=2605989 RepID=A0A517WJ74_9PLAN|nr:hypothetical protein [Gimesia chilikensis]QDU05286.1 transaldolase/EF-hand domain-containing protein [Gimesia chilikensis]
MRLTRLLSVGTTLLAISATSMLSAQPPEGGDRPERGDRPEGRERGPRDGERGPRDRGPGGRGNFMMMLPIFVVLDVNKDGEISKEEMENATAALKKLDKDKDGKLSQEELRPDFGNFGRRDGDRRGPGGSFGRRDGDGGGDFVERMMANDKNKDGKITKDELPERMQRMFDNIDTNKDKALDKAELTKTAEQFNARFRSRGGDRGGRGGDRGRRNSDGDRPKRPESDNSDN